MAKALAALAGGAAAPAAAATAAGTGATLGSLAAPLATGLGQMGPLGKIAGAAVGNKLTPELLIGQGFKALASGSGGGQQGGSEMQDPGPAAMAALSSNRPQFDPQQLQAILSGRAKFGR